MVDFFTSIGNGILTIVQFIVNLVDSLLTAIAILAQSSGMIASLMTYFPAILGSAVAVTSSIFIVRFLLLK